ncbi:ADP-ribosylation factor guanine nucleotide-exchange factor 1(brefeldin A-inhibited) [Angomonas deanei]|uniref:SEC7 domain-containing protein n=1 Tax=Angomonas deanei TaxID=59799 RepID=A0A7G2C891_9TRYP|nr:ADP-ribosylation factor guanine nucleotide-exchange factor 1(brefeldin A-inhibited) [Angomonas deanei]CAD2214953.1 Guanine nucleotide exchange factor in Golgi transport N-terminal/Sec7 domain/Domain of unknown function (DUF1981), putative [Angomonas deanei]|eukprot:EPY28173.1 ADP-ribosylation factor guanine nucleotide-exchange factor 1(brefeldin A-inhibited) [Angomonas deanei]
MQAPLLSSSDVPLPSDAHSFLNAYEAAVKDVMNVASASYPTLVSCFQVILYIIVNGGPPLRNSLTVLECIRTSVIPTCIKSSVSDDFDVFKLSLNILLVCCNRFGEMLLNETYTVFRHVYFRVLESKITSQDQKALVIDSLRKFIEEPQNLIGLFLNYDCNTHSASIYEEMIHYLGSIARPPQLKSLGRLNLDLDSVVSKRMECSFGVELRRKAVLTLLLIAESNIQWIERFDLGSSDVLSELNTAAHLLEEDAAETGNDTNEVNHTEGTSVVNQTEMIIHARRYKDAFKKFTTLFNTKNTPKAAVEYFIGCPILHASSTNESKNDEPSEEAPKSPTADSTGTQVKNQDGASCEAVEVASFLKENEDYLDKMALGEYFAKSFSNTTSRLVFQEWINLHDFKDMTLDEALRLFLGGFKLLGEAQVVDRTMELFAAHYCSQNPSVFTQADTAFILSFSICMLNTDAHSPHVKNKMTLEGFIKNNRGIDEGKDVDPNVLKGIYERITQNEIVLRPSPKCSNQTQSNSLTDKGSEKKKTRAGILESIPILKHLSPIATAITDKVLLPMDSANIFGISQKRRQELYQDELKEALREVMGALASQGSVTAPDMFQTATSIENALPMWEISVDLVANLYLAAVCEFMEAAESYDTSSVLPNTTPNAVDSTDCYLKINDNQEYFDALMMGLTNIIRVCCSFGNSMQTELLLESSYELTNISQVVSVSNPQKPVVTVVGPLSMVRIELLSRYVDLYAAFGSFFSSRMWQAAYSSVSFLDVLANGIDGLWRRQDKHLLFSKQNANTVKADPSLYTDMFFGNLTLVPPSIENNSWKNRYQILSSIRVARSKTQSVDYWVEKLFDATCYPSSAQLQMSNALSLVCGRELQHGRTFSLTKLFDFVTICAPISTRLQWRDLWMNVMPVFISAGNMKASVCNPTLDGLRLIALSYLTREELVNYSFQKEVLRPFGEIFMANSSAGARKKIIDIVAELVDLRAAYLASGWHVVFSCLSRAAGFPEVVEQAWSVCLHIVKRHIEHVKEYFNDLVFCFASFAGCEVEEIALCSLSFSVACGHWLQYGLDPVPSDVTTPQDVLRWATRMKSADIELSTMAHLDKKYPRVSLAQEPLSGTNLLQPPSDFTTKTVYQLWLSLFECMVPVIVTHKMVRVRAHAISAMLNLLSFYGCLFEEEVQASIVLGVLKRLATTLIKETPTEDTKEEYDRTDYKLLVLLMTKGMFTASNDCPSMARLTSTALRSIIENIQVYQRRD